MATFRRSISTSLVGTRRLLNINGSLVVAAAAAVLADDDYDIGTNRSESNADVIVCVCSYRIIGYSYACDALLRFSQMHRNSK